MQKQICKDPNCNNEVLGHENMDTGYCRRCWLKNWHEHMPGVEMTGADWENFSESE